MKTTLNEEIALKRYALVLPVINGSFLDLNAEAYYKRICAEPIMMPTGESKNFATGTIRGWVNIYRKKGFDGLKPRNRSDYNTTRKISPVIKNLIFNLKKENPRKNGVSIYSELIKEGIICKDEFSLSTIQRYLHKIRSEIGAIKHEDMRAFEMEFANESWQIDTSHGPWITVGKKKYKTYMIMIIDDASRLIVGHDIFLADNAVNVQLVLKTAILTYGVPKMLYTDNGGPYRNNQMSIICANLGIDLRRAAPYHGNQKGKIERNFRSVKDSWMHNLDYSKFANCEELNLSLAEYVNDKNNKMHSSLKETPFTRYVRDHLRIKRLPTTKIEESFLHTADRKVANDNTLKLLSKVYETAQKYIGMAVVVKYQPDLSVVYLVDDEDLIEIHLVDKVGNSKVRRNKPGIYGTEEEDVTETDEVIGEMDLSTARTITGLYDYKIAESACPGQVSLYELPEFAEEHPEFSDEAIIEEEEVYGF